MTIYNEVTDCKTAPDPTEIAPISGMLAEADNCTKKALAMAMRINAACFGKQAKEQKTGDPCCMRDVIALHVEELKALCEELNDISRMLGV